GTFALRLDPGVYQLEIQTSPAFPVVRRLVRVTSSGTELPVVALAAGRTLTARILRDAGSVVPQALLRVYRLETLEDGTPRALLLGEDVSAPLARARALPPHTA